MGGTHRTAPGGGVTGWDWSPERTSQDWGAHTEQPFGGGSHGKFWVLGAGETDIVGLEYRVWEGC